MTGHRVGDVTCRGSLFFAILFSFLITFSLAVLPS